MFYAIFSHKRSTQASTLIALLAISIGVFVTGYYYYIQDPLFHQNAFALLTAIVFFWSVYVMETNLRPSRRGTNQPSRRNSRDDARDLEILRVMWKIVTIGLSCLTIGFVLWNLDTVFCSYFRRWRHAVGLPWGMLLEGHGWW